jgi:hypothetical protein
MGNHLILTLIILVFLFNNNIFSQDEIKLIYTTSNVSETLAREGVYEGDKLVLYNDGTIERYSRYYPYPYRKRPAREELIKISRIPQYGITQLNMLFSEYIDILEEEMASPDFSGGIIPYVRYNITFYLSADNYIQFSSYDIMSHKYPTRYNVFLKKLREKIYAFIKEQIPVKILPQNPPPFIGER